MIHSYAPLLNPLPFFMGNGTVAMGYATGVAVVAALAMGGNTVEVEGANQAIVTQGANAISAPSGANTITVTRGGNKLESEEC